MALKRNQVDHEYQILEIVRDNPGGVTVSDIVTLTKFSRNTVSKYVSVLEVKGEIFSKKIGAYRLYFATKRSFIPLDLALSYYKSLISRFKKYFPHQEEMAKKIGKEAAGDIKFTFSPNVFKQMKGLKDIPLSRVLLESFKTYYPVFDIFQPEIEISIVYIDPKEKKATFRFQNSKFLEDSDDFSYHIHIMSGIAEEIIKKGLKGEVECNVKELHIGNNKEESYFDIDIQIK